MLRKAHLVIGCTGHYAFSLDERKNHILFKFLFEKIMG